MSRRGNWQGMLAIARFNWPFYAAASVVLCLGVAGCFAGGIFSAAGVLAVLGCLWFLAGSLGVSHWVYDLSDLYRWNWTVRALENRRTGNFLLCHSGFDEVSDSLKREFPQAGWVILDHYDTVRMTEASIRRARKYLPPVAGTLPAPFDQWPLAEASADAIFGVLAIHEFRSVEERSVWFSEAARCLKPGGNLVLVEHVRDFANFLAFGPGFLHFHSVASWESSWQTGGFRLHDHFKVTSFVRIFVLKSS